MNRERNCNNSSVSMISINPRENFLHNSFCILSLWTCLRNVIVQQHIIQWRRIYDFKWLLLIIPHKSECIFTYKITLGIIAYILQSHFDFSCWLINKYLKSIHIKFPTKINIEDWYLKRHISIFDVKRYVICLLCLWSIAHKV